MVERFYRCACGDHWYTDEQIRLALRLGEVLPCLVCHDIFERTMDDQIVVHYPPPRAVYERMYDRSLKRRDTGFSTGPGGAGS